MTVRERTLRTSRVTGVRIEPVLTAALLAELMSPSEELWLVSPWISDVPVLDNSCGGYDALVADAVARELLLSEVLAMAAGAGTYMTIVTRPVEHNIEFLTALRRRAESVTVIEDPDVHEKTLCGQTWLVSGSMNFTLRGMQVNDEAMAYRLDERSAALARIEFSRRWGGRR